jgi:hypothetical protein
MYLVFVFLLISSVTAHLPFVEKERSRVNNFEAGPPSAWANWTPSEDFSFTSPFDIIAETSYVSVGPPTFIPKNVSRPDAGIVVGGLLKDNTDYDVLVYKKTTLTETPLLAYVGVPACQEYVDFYPNLSLLGPLNITDSKTGLPIFTPVSIPSDVPFNVPAGYGVKTVKQTKGTRPLYFTPFGSDHIMFPIGWNVTCVENYLNPTCTWDNSILIHTITPADYYWIVWNDHNFHHGENHNQDNCDHNYLDYDFITGLTDNFVPSDYSRLAGIGVAFNAGRLLHRHCTPVPGIYQTD